MIDGAEGGTGAAHFESLHFTGMPLAIALPIVDRALKKAELKEKIRLLASGKIISSLDILRTIEAGADGINMPHSSLWQVVTSLMSFSGLFIVTLIITWFNCDTKTCERRRRLRAFVVESGGSWEMVVSGKT